MTTSNLPETYDSLFDLRETERLIRTIKEYFQINLAKELNLLRVSAPLFVLENTGINELVLDLQGDTFVGEDGRMRWAFPRIEAELSEVKVLRRDKTVDRNLGSVIADSGPG